MYSNPQKLSSGEVLELRREAGRWLKGLREQRGLSQRQMAAAIGADYYTFISQIEAGRGRIPPDRYSAWAEALGIQPKTLVRTLLRYYDPVTYNALFGEEDVSATTSVVAHDARSPAL
jgi:transcriptional regulator with XRE-family HTH domain